MIISNKTYKWIKELFPICRSITGNGVRTTLAYFKKLLPELKIHEVPSGTKAFDWTVPDEWNIKDAFIADQSGNRIVDFKENNLHIVGYSVPVDSVIELEQLQKHLYSLPEQPDAIPYVTSYYKKRWGFCIQDNLRKKLKPGKYHVKIDSTLKPGSLTYGELIIKGKTRKEILLSTYVCHPSMANNELSGPAVTTALAEWILQNTDRKYTYRILFLPETIGSIVYLSKNAEIMKKNTIAGFVITCVGDDNRYSYLQSKYGNTLADRAARHTLSHLVSKYDTYSFLERGSDERQYCSPGIDLPVCSIMRSKYGEFPEYHTSLDNLSFISPKGLEGAYNILKNCLILLEANEKYKIKTYCEPQLGKRGMYPSVSTKKRNNIIGNITNLITYADGKHDLLEIADIIGIYAGELIPTAEKLLDKGLFEIIDHFSTETD